VFAGRSRDLPAQQAKPSGSHPTAALFVALNLALSVGAPVMVAALGNRNDTVKVFDAVRRITGL